MITLVGHSAILLLSFLGIFLWQKSGMTSYTFQLLGLLSIFYLLTLILKNKKNNLTTIFLLNTSSLLLIAHTGGINSNFFFLIYFLSFCVSLLLEPLIVFVFLAACFLFFLPQTLLPADTIKLGSLLLLCPLAYFFGNEFAKRRQLQEITNEQSQKTKTAADHIIKDVTEIVIDDNNPLPQEKLKKLRDIVKESNSLKN